MNDLSIVKAEETNWYSVKEICDICNTSRQTWINFKNEFNCKTGFTVKRNLREGDKNIDYYPEDILKTFQAWLLRNQANQGRASDTIKSIVKAAVKNEETNWISKKELMEICKCGNDSLERVIADLSSRTGAAIQSHIKKGGYHNSEVFYDDYLVKLIQAKLLSNQTNQGKTSDTIKSIVKTAVKNELTKTLSKDEIKLELARAKAQIEQYKAQIEQYKAQKQIITDNQFLSNVEEAITAGCKTAEEMYTTAGVCRDTFNQFLSDVEETITAGWNTPEEMYTTAAVCIGAFNQFLSDVKKSMSEKQDSRCRIDPTANLVVKLGSY